MARPSRSGLAADTLLRRGGQTYRGAEPEAEEPLRAAGKSTSQRVNRSTSWNYYYQQKNHCKFGQIGSLTFSPFFVH